MGCALFRRGRMSEVRYLAQDNHPIKLSRQPNYGKVCPSSPSLFRREGERLKMHVWVSENACVGAKGQIFVSLKDS